MRRGFRVLVDTSVWLDLAKDYRKLSLLDALEDLVGAGVAELILPRIIFDEFERDRARVLEDANRGVASVLRRARSLVERLADENNKPAALAQLDQSTSASPGCANGDRVTVASGSALCSMRDHGDL